MNSQVQSDLQKSVPKSWTFVKTSLVVESLVLPFGIHHITSAFIHIKLTGFMD